MKGKASRKRGARRAKIPTRRELRVHLQRHVKAQRVLKRLAAHADTAKDDLISVGAGGNTTVVALIDEIIEGIKLVINIVKACNAIYEAMDATVTALDNPGVTGQAREDLHKQLGALIESAAEVGCP